MSEQDYMNGQCVAWIQMLRMCMRELGPDDPESDKARWILERAETVAALRSACDKSGDNNWPDDAYLPDVIEKHLISNVAQER